MAQVNITSTNVGFASKIFLESVTVFQWNFWTRNSNNMHANMSSNNFWDQLKVWSKLIGLWWLWPVNQHNSKLTIEILQDLQQYNKCDYGFTTTWQQNHNRFSEGFKNNKNVIMVSQPHNSEFTIDNLQVLKSTIQIN